MKKFVFIISLAILLQLCIILFTYNYPKHPIVYHYTVDLNCWFNMFENIARGKIPMVDFGIEYPAGTVLLYWLFGLVYFSKAQFLIFHSIFMLFIFIVSFIYLYKLIKLLNIPHHIWILLLYALSPTLLILNHVRFDMVPVALTLIGLYYYKKNRLYLPSILLGIGTSMKWFPAFMVIALVWEEFLINKKFLKALKLCIISFSSYILLDLLFIAISYIKHGNITNWLYSFLANARLSIYTDTIPGLIKIFYGKVLPTYLPLYITGGLFLIITIIPYPKNPLPRYILYCLGFLMFNKIYSPQFHFWFLPFLVLYIAQTKYYKLGFIAIIFLELVNISVYPFSFSVILQKLGRFELGPIFPILSFNVFSYGIIIRAILLLILSLYIYSPKATLYLTIVSSVIFLSSQIDYVKKDKTIEKRLAQLYKSIPQGAGISTDSSLYPYLKNKFPTSLYTIDKEPEYILLNTSQGIHNLGWLEYKKLLINLLANKRYGVIGYIYGYLLLGRDSPTHMNESIAKDIFGLFEAEYMAGRIGVTIKDPKAHNRLARAGYNETKGGHLIYGPYMLLSPGIYEVSFRLKIDDNEVDQLIAKIDVAGKVGQKIYAQKDIYARDFKSANRYQSFKLDFTISEFDRVEFRVYLTGKGDLTVDRIKVFSDKLTIEEICNLIK